MTLEGHKSMVWCLDKIDDNKLISGGSDRRALVWDIKEKDILYYNISFNYNLYIF